MLAVIDQFFEAVRVKDREAILALVKQDGLATAVRIDGPQWSTANWHWPSYAEMAVTAKAAWTEHLIAPRVMVERDIAAVWARYELSADGVFSHCGVNHFDLVRQGGKWRIYNLTWTNQKKGCPGRE